MNSAAIFGCKSRGFCRKIIEQKTEEKNGCMCRETDAEKSLAAVPDPAEGAGRLTALSCSGFFRLKIGINCTPRHPVPAATDKNNEYYTCQQSL
jgi:hypothetical protein